MTAIDSAWTACGRVARRFGLLGLAVAFVAERSISGILSKVGHPAAPLDDAYIHFQYARAIAEGHPMRFQAGAPVTSGATSFLWPALLAPFWALGARGNAILWAAWVLSFAALGALAWEAAKLTERLAGRAASIGAGAMVVAFGGFVWCAASGMEVVPFAWAIARASRRASEWSEISEPARTRGRRAELIALAWIAALMRPEGAVTAIFVAATLLLFANGGTARPRLGRGVVETRTARPRLGRGVVETRSWVERAWSLAAVGAAGAIPLLLMVLTGSALSNTAIAKLMPGNPYYSGHALMGAVETNAKLLIGTLLNGEAWSAEFLPQGGAAVASVGLGAVVLLGIRTRCSWRAAAVLLVALTMFAPCFYLTFLWNRLRYLWPFATGWIVGLACLSRVVGDLLGAARPRWRLATPLVCGGFVGLLAARLGWVMDDVAQSASGIDRQQIALGRWADANLPRDARIGVNDTGAIAYFGRRQTFDIVGLTTAGEARYWAAGTGSRFEHYERLAPQALPTHFIVYPEWMAMETVLGDVLHQATVTDATILGGKTMRAYTADWSALGSGEKPWSARASAIVDALDVADLESEAEHQYDLFGAREGEEVAHQGVDPDGATVVDGGRTRRVLERFTAHLRPGVATKGIVRLDGSSGARFTIFVRNLPVGTFDVGDDDWVELAFDVPAEAATPATSVELRVTGGTLTTFHYWFVDARG